VNRKIFVFVLTALSGLFFYSSCTKIDTTDLGSELIPAVDNISTFETILDVETDNFIFNDTTRLSNSFAQAVGIIQDDPEFGRTEAAMYVSMVPAVYGTHPFGTQDSIKVDSVVLSLAYTSQYGDSNSLEKFEVYQIDPAGNFKDSVYRISEPDFAVKPALLGSKDVDFKTLDDSLMYVNNEADTIRTSHMLRIKLDTAFARQFINYDTANQYKTDSAFRTYFKGLAIKINNASAAKNGLAYFDITNTTNTALSFYTRNTKGGVIDTVTTVFTYGAGAQANLIRRTPAHNYLAYLNNGNTKDDKVYIQSAPGSYATVKIPGLDTFKNVNRVIHRAELIIEKITSAQDNFYTPPPYMFIDAINATGDSTFTIRNDFVPASTGGLYDIATLGGTLTSDKYVFNLSRYLQSVVSKKLPYYTLRIYAPLYARPWYMQSNGIATDLLQNVYVNEPIAFGRLVAGGGNAATQKMRVRIIYSKI
jgi:hypothetical protein